MIPNEPGEYRAMWVVICNYPQKAKFYLGNIQCRANAPHHERDQKAFELMDEILPSRASISGWLQGQIIFVPAEQPA